MEGLGMAPQESGSVGFSGWPGRRVLVPGGLGFLGLNTVASLVRQGAFVRVLSRSLPPLALLWLDHLRHGLEVEVLEGDIANESGWPGWLDGIDTVIHLAGESGAAKSLQQAWLDLRVNVEGHLTLLDALRERPAAPRLVFASSRLVYGRTGRCAVNEEHLTAPTSLYGVHKLTIEHYLRIYGLSFGLESISLRLTNPFGPYQLPARRTHGFVNRFVIQALGGEPILVYGEGRQQRDVLFVDDAVEAILAAADHASQEAPSINVGAGASLPLMEIAGKVAERVDGALLENRPWPATDRLVETGDFFCDRSLAERVLGWSPKAGLDEGLDRTVAFYRSCAGRIASGKSRR